ncbi:MAG: (d)CMP kinase [Bdellovibrionales bacterium]
MTPNLITIDGPSASGKSSVSRELGRRLGWKWVSTGAFYRGLAYVAVQEGIVLNEVASLVSLSQADSVWWIRMDSDRTRVFWRGSDVTDPAMSEDNGSRASVVSRIPEVRAALLGSQRRCADGVPGLVAEGRDCGTVVFPQALLKIYLTASQEERAARRAREQGLNLEKTQSQQEERDFQDSSRRTAPLQIPPQARIVDSNGMSLEQVIDQVHMWAEEALARGIKSL